MALVFDILDFLIGGFGACLKVVCWVFDNGCRSLIRLCQDATANLGPHWPFVLCAVAAACFLGWTVFRSVDL